MNIHSVVQAVGGLLVSVVLALGHALAGIPDTIARVKPSVVALGSYQKTRSPAFVFRGTGFAVGDGTLVATNAHVLPESLDTQNRESLIALTFATGQAEPREVRVVGVDRNHDLALLRISGAALPALELKPATSVREGETYAFTGFPIGNALGLTPVTHRAMISAVTPIVLPTAAARQLDPKVIRRVKSGVFAVFQLDATAYPGNSGSPLYEVESGQVVGIVNMVFVKGTRETALSQPSGISFAVPIGFLRELLGTIH